MFSLFVLPIITFGNMISNPPFENHENYQYCCSCDVGFSYNLPGGYDTDNFSFTYEYIFNGYMFFNGSNDFSFEYNKATAISYIDYNQGDVSSLIGSYTFYDSVYTLKPFLLNNWNFPSFLGYTSFDFDSEVEKIYQHTQFKINNVASEWDLIIYDDYNSGNYEGYSVSYEILVALQPIFKTDLNNTMSNLISIMFTDYGRGYSEGYTSGYDDGVSVAYSSGYTDGYNDGIDVDSTAYTIFNGILNVGMLPINFFLAIFNFEILGINISALVSAGLSVCLVIIVSKSVFGGKGSE